VSDLFHGTLTVTRRDGQTTTHEYWAEQVELANAVLEASDLPQVSEFTLTVRRGEPPGPMLDEPDDDDPRGD
jgi:hypothetical protein